MLKTIKIITLLLGLILAPWIGFRSAAAATASQNVRVTINEKGVLPVTTDNYDHLWHNEDFVIYLSASSAQSGINYTYYKINNGDTRSVKTADQPVICREGTNNTLEYWSVDQAGNEEMPHKTVTGIKLDKTPPLINLLSPENETAFNNSPITVTGNIIDNLSGAASVEIEVGDNTYSSDLDLEGNFSIPDVEISAGPNTIVVLAKDNAGNQADATVNTFLGWLLHLNMPYYKTAEYYSGAPACQMVLNYIRNGVIDKKTNNLALELAEAEIYNYGHPYNSAENLSLLDMDPNAIDYALGHFDPYDPSDPTGQGDTFKGYNYSVEVFESSKFMTYLRDIIHWMAYPVTIGYWWKDGDLTAHPNTPAIVPAYGNYQHWIVVNGASTSGDPIPQPHTNPGYTPNFTVYGLWLTDPASGGIGKDLYVTSMEAQDTYLLPVNSSDIYNGKFIQIAEPPQAQSDACVDIGDLQTNEETCKVIDIAGDLSGEQNKAASLVEKRAEGIRKHIYDRALTVNLDKDSHYCAKERVEGSDADALSSIFESNCQSPIELDWNKIIDASLLTNDEFRKAFDGSQARSFVKVRRLDKDNDFYYLIPFDKYAKGQFLTYAAIILDAGDGSFKEASWLDSPMRFIQIDREEAARLILSQESLPADTELNIELVWEPSGLSSSPFYPYWRVVAADKKYYVTQEGKVYKERAENE